jgi:hypothetical protein
MLSYHVHTNLAPRTPIRFLFLIRIIMPQVKNLRRHYWIVGNSIYSTVTLGVAAETTCRRSGRNEVMSKQSEGMAPLRSRRVHGDPKMKNPSNACTKSNIELLECRSRRSKWRWDDNLEEPPTWPGSGNTKELLRRPSTEVNDDGDTERSVDWQRATTETPVGL